MRSAAFEALLALVEHILNPAGNVVQLRAGRAGLKPRARPGRSATGHADDGRAGEGNDAKSMDRAARAVLSAHVGIMGGPFDCCPSVNLGLHAIGELRSGRLPPKSNVPGSFPPGTIDV
jgi:hypothetical protein